MASDLELNLGCCSLIFQIPLRYWALQIYTKTVSQNTHILCIFSQEILKTWGYTCKRKWKELPLRRLPCIVIWLWVLPEPSISICKPFFRTSCRLQASLTPQMNFRFFLFCLWPWTRPWRTHTGGGREAVCFSPSRVVFYQLISNTWSYANPLTPLAVSAHTNRNKHAETHYINCLLSPMLIIS